MSKIDKDLKELEQKIDKHIKQAKIPSKLEEIQYGDWKQVAELEDFTIQFKAGSLLGGSKAEVTFKYKLPKNRPEHERKKLIVFGDADSEEYKNSMKVLPVLVRE